jgi:hypothetical protein
MSYTISSANPIEFLNPSRQWKMGHKGQLKELDVSGVINISGDMHCTNKITGFHMELSGDVSINSNLCMSGKTTFKSAPYQEIDSDLSYIYYTGSFGLAKHSLPKQDDTTSKKLISNSTYLKSDLTAANPLDLACSVELRRMMLVGMNGYYASSTDGIFWDVSGVSSTNRLKQIIWANEQQQFVIVGDNGYVAISTDSTAIDVSSTIASVNTLNSIAWSPQLGIYLTVGLNNSNVAFSSTSVDAITWSNNTVLDDIEYLSSVIWVPEIKRFVAAGSYTPNGGLDHYAFYASTLDGIIWDISGQIASNSDSQLNSVMWSREQGRLSAVGEAGFYASARAEKDSLIWDYSGNITGITKYTKVIWASHLQRFVAVGTNGVIGNYISSLDGVIWDLSGDIPKPGIGVCWTADIGKLFIPDTNGSVYYTAPKFVLQTTYNLFEDATLNVLKINGDSSFNKNVYIEENTVVNGSLDVNGDVSFNARLDVSGITTLFDHLLTDSSNVKVPVSYSTFAVAKGADLSSNITQNYEIWHDLSGDGYMVTISPLTQNSYIKLDFKVNYVCSNLAEQTISFRVKNHNNDIIFTDLSLGTTTGVTNKGIYNGLYIDSTGYNSPVTYYLEYLIANDAANNTDVSSGVLGYNHGNSNIVIAQELYIPIEIS